jgi:Zn2+/Cd2+-exporting ATPase
MTQLPALKTQRMRVGRMDCTSCALKIERSVENLAGVSEISVVVATGQLIVTYNPQLASEADIKQRVTALGYTIGSNRAKSPDSHNSHDHSSHNRRIDAHDYDHNHGGEFSLKREGLLVGVVIALFVVGSIFEATLHNTLGSIGEYLLFIPAYLLSGWTVLTSARHNILRGQVFDENFLMTIATIGAIAIHKLPEAVGVMLFFKIGELFQELAVSRSRRSITALLEIRPDTANLKTDNGIQIIAPERVKVGDTIIIKPGEKVPLDGKVIDGKSQVDTSALTGESVPQSVKVGETVLAGTINQTGVLTVTVTKLFGESSIARILDLVENASSKKAETEKFITKFARQYTPIVVISSLAVALIPPLIIPGTTYAEWAYRALILLVISCPCGLVISIPLGYFGGIGGAAKQGILVKGSTFLDTLAGVKAIAFDKTGTLTKGVFKVTEIVSHNGFKQVDLLRIAAEVESNSNHPIAKSIRSAYNHPIDESLISNYTEIAAHGIQATIDGKVVLAGNDRLMHREHITYDTCDIDGTVVHLAVDKIYAGYIAIADEIKEDAVRAIRDLKAAGVEKIVMLTGDSQAVARRIAKTLGVDDFEAELLPEDKVAAVEKLLFEFARTGKVTFVGDGINDAPVIARADVGIAMGGLGSDAAIETADVVLMTDSPDRVATAIQLGKKTHSIVLQNIIFALTIKAIFIGLGLLGLATMWEAVFADVGVALAAIFNATRVLKPTFR